MHLPRADVHFVPLIRVPHHAARHQTEFEHPRVRVPRKLRHAAAAEAPHQTHAGRKAAIRTLVTEPFGQIAFYR